MTAYIDDVGKRDAQAQLDGLQEEVNKRKMSVEEQERRAVAAALVEERMRYCVLIGCLKPLAVSITLPKFPFFSNICLIFMSHEAQCYSNDAGRHLLQGHHMLYTEDGH